MKHIVSFLVVAVALLQMTVAAPVVKKSEKKFACMSRMPVLSICILSNEIRIMAQILLPSAHSLMRGAKRSSHVCLNVPSCLMRYIHVA